MSAGNVSLSQHKKQQHTNNNKHKKERKYTHHTQYTVCANTEMRQHQDILMLLQPAKCKSAFYCFKMSCKSPATKNTTGIPALQNVARLTYCIL